MRDQPPDNTREIQVPSGERDVAIGTVSTGDTWSFSAAGEWRTGFVRCGPDGYRNFLFDALEFAPRVPGAARLKLMGKFRDEPDSAAFPIGAGCTQTFARSGELVVFANDQAEGYGDNRGSLILTAAPGGVAVGPVEDGGVRSVWNRFRDVFSRTKGIPVIAAFVLGVSWDPGVHAAGPGFGARDRRRRFPSVSVLPAANRLCGHAALPRHPGLELVPNHYRFELWRGSCRLAAKTIADLDAAPSRGPSVRSDRVGVVDESGQKYLVCFGADRSRLDLFHFGHQAPGHPVRAQASRRHARAGATL